MRKSTVIRVVGDGSVVVAARRLGLSSSGVSQWPEDLPRYAEDRVLGTLVRKGFETGHLDYLVKLSEVLEQRPAPLPVVTEATTW